VGGTITIFPALCAGRVPSPHFQIRSGATKHKRIGGGTVSRNRGIQIDVYLPKLVSK